MTELQVCGDLKRPEEMRIDAHFTLEKLCKLCDIKVRWTGNLKDHLRYDHSTANLHLHAHTACLLSHKECPCEIIPIDLIDETLRSLNILPTFEEKKTPEYLQTPQRQVDRVFQPLYHETCRRSQ